MERSLFDGGLGSVCDVAASVVGVRLARCLVSPELLMSSAAGRAVALGARLRLRCCFGVADC